MNPDSPDGLAFGQPRAPILALRSSSYAGSGRRVLTADGDPLSLPQTDKPEIISVIGTLQPGGRTALHQHPVPVYVYVMKGELEVQTEGGEPRHYRAGEAFLESVDRWHQAFNGGSSVTKILVVFVGEEGKPTTIARQ